MYLLKFFRQLFKQVIAQSGSPLIPWGYQPNPRSEVEKLGHKLGLKWTTSQGLVDQLRMMHADDLTALQQGWNELETPRGHLPFQFCPCIEPPDSPEPRFLSQDPNKIYRSGNFTAIPAIMGSTSVR